MAFLAFDIALLASRSLEFLKFGTSPYLSHPENVFCGKKEIISSFIPRIVNPIISDSYAFS
jgi:hypothetical protein